MIYKNNIIFLSDNLNTINNYRSDLINELKKNNSNISLYSIKNFIFNIVRIINSQLIISSNIRSNLLALFFFKNNRLIILNGLGRLSNSYLLRYIFILLLRFQSNYVLSVQNFRDYRWLKINGIDCYLVYGSGGRSFYSNPKGNTVLVISRNSKILLQIKSLVKFAKNFPSTKYEFIGFTDEAKKLSIFDSLFRGHLAPKNFFINSNVFFQPSGY